MAALAFDRTGRSFGRAAILTAIGFELARRRRWVDLTAFGLAEAATPASVNLTKLLVRRRRPPGASTGAFGTSFPSGHAAYAAATSVALVLLHDELGERQRRAAWIAAGAGSLGMAWSRTYLRLHWLSDVTAGVVLGAGVTLTVFELVTHRAAAAGRRV